MNKKIFATTFFSRFSIAIFLVAAGVLLKPTAGQAAANSAWGEAAVNFVQNTWTGTAGTSQATQTGWANFTSETAFTNSTSNLQITAAATTAINITNDSTNPPVVGVSAGGFKYTNATFGGLDYTDTTQVVGTGDAASVTNEYTTEGSDKVVNGGNHTCALNHDRVYCWGGNDRGQLGLGTSSDTPFPTLVTAGDCATRGCSSGYLEDIVDIAAGDKVTCVINNKPAAGTIYCWGLNEQGQLGIGTNTGWFTSPRIITRDNSGGPMTGFSKISVGDDSVCALRLSDGRVWCWGNNGAGQLGIGATGDRTYPTPVVRGACPVSLCPTTNLSNVSQISTGDKHACAIIAGYAFCWGGGGVGQLGDGTTGGDRSPVRVLKGQCLPIWNPLCIDATYISNVVDISAGNQHTCAIVASSVGALGTSYCWGSDKFGELGQGGLFGNALTPVDILYPSTNHTTNRNTLHISAGKNHTCAIYGSPNAQVYCWGGNGYGQVGVGNYLNQMSPVLTSPAITATQISSSFGNDNGGHTCALTVTYIYCWGANNRSQLGGSVNPSESSPIQVRSDWVGEGYYESGIIFSATTPTWQDFFWNQTLPTLNEHLYLQVRTSANGDFSAVPWSGCPSYQSHFLGTLTSPFTPFTGCVTSGHQYIQYRARLVGSIANSPLLNSIGFRYGSYNTTATLISSIYDTGNSQIIIDSLSWNQIIASGTSVTVSLRTSPNADMTGATAWKALTGTTSGCSGSPVVTCGDTALTGSPNFQNMIGDRYVQYRVQLTGTGLTPAVDDVVIGYFVPRGRFQVNLRDQLNRNIVAGSYPSQVSFASAYNGGSVSCSSPTSSYSPYTSAFVPIGSYIVAGCSSSLYNFDSLNAANFTSGTVTRGGTISITFALYYDWIPYFTEVQDESSSATNPTNVGDSFEFITQAIDYDGQTIAHVICKGTSPTTHSPAVPGSYPSTLPTCPDGSWAISSYLASGSTLTRAYVATASDPELGYWWAYACNTYCSVVSQGTFGDGRNSPFSVNHPPNIVSNSIAAISSGGARFRVGNTVTFRVSAWDQDVEPSQDQVTMSVCRNTGLGGTTCNNQPLCTPVTTAAGPSAGNPAAVSCGTYTITEADRGQTITYYVYLFDPHGLATSPNPQAGQFYVEVNEAPSSVAFDQPLPRSMVVDKTYTVSGHGVDNDAPSGDILTCTWTVAVKPTGSVADVAPNTPQSPCSQIDPPSSVSFTPDLPGNYQLRLQVTDTAGESISGLTPNPASRTLPSWIESSP